MPDETRGGPVLVGVENAEHGLQLIRTASDFASLGDGTVRLVTVRRNRTTHMNARRKPTTSVVGY